MLINKYEHLGKQVLQKIKESIAEDTVNSTEQIYLELAIEMGLITQENYRHSVHRWDNRTASDDGESIYTWVE